MPHGHCFFWQPSLVWLHVISDSLIAAAYFSIPVTLYYFIRKRPDAKLRGVILMFAGFILACGMTHLLAVWDIWHSAYRLEGLTKAITAALSIATAFVAIRLGPTVTKMASPEQLEAINERLRLEIEARDKAEQKLRQYVQAAVLASEDKLHSFFEAASQGILGVASDGCITLVNRRTEEMFGYTRGELLGQHLEMLLPGRFRSGHAAHRERYFAEPRMRSMGVGMELAGLRKDGTEFPIEIGLSHVNTPEGALAFGMVTDISERRRIARELERVNNELRRSNSELTASEEMLRACVEGAPQAIVGVVGGYITLVNRQTEEMFGYTREELIGQPLTMLYPDRGIRVGLDDAFSGPPIHVSEGPELYYRRKDGSEFPFKAWVSRVDLPEGPLFFGMISDISESKKAADEIDRINRELRDSNAGLRASEERFRTFLELAPVAIVGVAADGRIALVNRRTEQLVGYSRRELLGQPGTMLYSEREQPVYEARLDNLLADIPNHITEFGAAAEIFMRRKDGSQFPLTAGVAKLNLPEGPLAFQMIMDISESKKTADDLKRANEELRRSNIEIEQFAHVASHDLQEPLRMITSYLQLIERRYPDRLDASGKEFIAFAVDGSKRMKKLIRDLLEFSRAGTHAVNFREIDTGAILDNALENLKIAIDESSTVITVDPMPILVGDPVLLTQVFQNLIANAIKFQQSAAPNVHISAQRKGAEWIFSVRDNGIGIEPRHLERIFRIFERLHSVEEYSGSGIGLAITRKIVERHLGRIWVESQVGSGSTFFFSLAAEMVIATDKSNLSLSATR